MRRFARFTVTLVCLAATLGAPAARADILPPNACDTLGAPCDNVGGGSAEPGICSAETCRRDTGLGGADGVMYYDCLLCEPVAGGTGGAGGIAGSGGVAEDAGMGGMAGMAGAIVAIGGATIAPGGNAGEAEIGGAGGVTGAGGTPVEPGHDDGDDGGCGCSFKSGGSERTAVVLMLALGLTALRRQRRRP